MKNQSKVLIKEPNILDLSKIHKMFNSLSEKTKSFFHPGFLGFESVNFWWILAQIGLIMSTIKILRKLLLYIFPFPIFLSVMAVIRQDQTIGFAYLKIKNRLPSRNLSAVLGIVVADPFQGKGLGSKLMENILRLAREENVKEIFVSVLPNNVQAIHLYEKYGFKYIGQTVDYWRRNKSKAIIMKLNLKNPSP